MTKLEAHAIAQRYPWDESACAGIVEYLREHGGVPIPIVLYEGKILDGLHRYEACKRLGRQPRTREFGSDESDGASPELFAWKMNALRRHLTPVQLAALAVRANDDAHRAEAASRRTEGGKVGGQNSGKARLGKLPQDLEEASNGAKSRCAEESLAITATEVGSNRGAAYRAQKIERASPEVFKKMLDGQYQNIAAAERDAGVPTPGANAREKPEPPKSKPRREAPDAKGAPLHERSYLDPELRARVVELIGEGRSQSEAASILEFGDAAYLGGAVGGFKRPSDSVTSKVSQIRRELLPVKAESPLAGKVKLVEAMADDFKSWGNKLDDPQWSKATPAQVADLCAHVDSMVSAARKFLSKVSKEVQS